MSEFFQYLFTEAPWLRPLLAWALGLLLLALILSAPAYLLFWPFLERVRKQLADYINVVAIKLNERNRERKSSLNAEADEFLKDGGLWRLKSDTAGRWKNLSDEIIGTLKRLHSQVSQFAKTLQDLRKRIIEIGKKIESHKMNETKTLPTLPDANQVAESDADLRVAKTGVILLGLILLGLMLVNTGMLSQILRDIGVIPEALTFFGINLAYVLAFLLTLAEAGIGAAHGMSKAKSVDSERLSVAPFLWSTLAVAIALVEGFFYSSIGSTTERFTIPFIGYEMTQSNLFFIWGFSLVMILFGLGMMTYESLAKLRRGNVRTELQRELDKLWKTQEAYGRAVKHSQDTVKKTIVEVKDADVTINGPANNSHSVQEELVRITKQLEDLRNTSPAWAKDSQIRLTRSEVLQHAQSGGVWLFLTIVAMFAITLTTDATLRTIYPNILNVLSWSLAVGSAIVFFGIGFLLSAGETVVFGNDVERRVWAAPRYSLFLGYLVGGCTLLGYILIFFFVAWPMQLGDIWVLSFIIGLLLIAAGYQLNPLSNVIRLFLVRMWNLVIRVVEVILILLLRLSGFIVVILEHIAHFFAVPLIMIFGRRSELAKPGN